MVKHKPLNSLKTKTMKKQLHINILICGVVRKLFFLFTLLNISMATAQTFTVNGVSYNVITGTTNVEITQGACPTGVLVIPATVVENAITYSVTSIGDIAFQFCSSLTSVVIPNSVTSIGFSAFQFCSSLTSVVIPNSVTSIEYFAFASCTSLTSVSIPNSIKSLEEYVFSGCDSLTSLIIPDSVITIGNSAFADCLDLTNVTFPSSVTSIGDFAFSNCTGLTSVVIPNSVTTIGLYSFNRCTSLSSVSIPNSIKSFEEGVFSGCDSLTSITIPDSVISIGNFAFADCLDLTNVTFPNSVTSIGIFAFQFCSGLVSITIPNSVTSIGDYAFTNCSNLTTINCDIVTPLVINANVFGNVNQAACALNVPSGSVGLYQAAAVWKDFNPINGALNNKSFVNKNKIKLYPNPVSNNLTIENPSADNLQLEVFNQLGQKVLKQNQNASLTSLDVSNLSKGLYFLNINTENDETQTIKFIKN